MDKKLLEKIERIEERTNRIEKLIKEETKEREIVNDLFKDLLQFCPFKRGDIICQRGDIIMKFQSVESAGKELGGRFYLMMNVLFPNSSDAKFSDNARTKVYYFNESKDWTILRHVENENQLVTNE